MTAAQPQFEWVDSDARLAQLCQQWRDAETLALDTEFVRTNTFFPRPGLIQCAVDRQCYLLDPLRISDFSPLAELFQAERPLKLIHAAGEDLEVFQRLLGVIPQPLLDTQLAAALIGLDFSISYQRLCESLLSIELSKGETRSDWLQRPLSASQCHYAALDVLYLPQLYQRLRDQLEHLQRLDWWYQDSAQKLLDYQQQIPPQQYYQKVKGAWKLSPEALTVLQRLIAWREQRARDDDLPRSWVLKDAEALLLAQRQPQAVADMQKLGVNGKTLRRYGDAIAAIMQQGLQASELLAPLPAPLPRETAPVMKQLKQLVQQRADELQVASEVLCKKKDFEALFRRRDNTDELPAHLCGWRKPIIVDQLVSRLQQHPVWAAQE